MPAKSKAQQKAAIGEAGRDAAVEIEGSLALMADSMSEKQLEEFAQTKRKALPEHKSRSK